MSDGRALRAARQRIGWTLREAARRWGVPHTRLVAWELGRSPAPPEYRQWICRVAQAIERLGAPSARR